MMTCFTPSALRSDHVHFIDGARGGYASAATALKAMPAESEASDRDFSVRIGSRSRHRRARRRSPRLSTCPDPTPKCCWHKCCRHRRCRSGRTICSDRQAACRMNSGSPIIGRLASAGLGFLSSTWGFPVAGSIGSFSQTMTPQIASTAFADAHFGVARLRQPDTAHLAAGLRLRRPARQAMPPRSQR